MKNEKTGIAVAGTILVDRINQVDSFPNQGELAKIKDVSLALGGCVPNVSIDIKALDKGVDVYAVGAVGNDDLGELVKSRLSSKNVDISRLSQVFAPTSFTEVISVTGGQRTFFTYNGANGHFGLDCIDFENLNVKMLHLGYFLLLDKVDGGDGVKILKEAKKRGICTSIDLVSAKDGDYKSVLSCLEYVDDLIVNELEAGRMVDLEPVDENLEEISRRLKELGVRDRVIIHKTDCAVCLSENGFTKVNSYALPKGYIKGSTGAGDAFCAGALLGVYDGLNDREILELASMAAVASLSEADATSGLKDKNAVIELCKSFERRK